MGKKVSAFSDPATRIDDDRRSAAASAWHTEKEETKTTDNSTAAVTYEQRFIIIRVNDANQSAARNKDAQRIFEVERGEEGARTIFSI